MNNFDRTEKDPKMRLDIGTKALIVKWLKDYYNDPNDFEVNGNIVTIKSGVIFLKDRKTPNLEGNTIFKTEGGQLIILDEIPIEEKLPTLQNMIENIFVDQKNKTPENELSKHNLNKYNMFKEILIQVMKETMPRNGFTR